PGRGRDPPGRRPSRQVTARRAAADPAASPDDEAVAAGAAPEPGHDDGVAARRRQAEGQPGVEALAAVVVAGELGARLVEEGRDRIEAGLADDVDRHLPAGGGGEHVLLRGAVVAALQVE